METITVMTPDLPDDERALRLAALRVGEVELTDAEKLVLEAVRALMVEGKKPAVRAVYERAGGNYSKTTTVLKRLRQLASFLALLRRLKRMQTPSGNKVTDKTTLLP